MNSVAIYIIHYIEKKEKTTLLFLLFLLFTFFLFSTCMYSTLYCNVLSTVLWKNQSADFLYYTLDVFVIIVTIANFITPYMYLLLECIFVKGREGGVNRLWEEKFF